MSSWSPASNARLTFASERLPMISACPDARS